ncbi:hypothetical protein C7212DRAFT_365114 [Tuber magnatum]|uniref:Uncharacterized protein n=1 Tax=Tuber magnatum TaxID=42249 RepID=A0A317SJH4_9PEZI|nr:hypothetical protein C7212DRAFT_365114 [Tuber magnatum]
MPVLRRPIYNIAWELSPYSRVAGRPQDCDGYDKLTQLVSNYGQVIIACRVGPFELVQYDISPIRMASALRRRGRGATRTVTPHHWNDSVIFKKICGILFTAAAHGISVFGWRIGSALSDCPTGISSYSYECRLDGKGIGSGESLFKGRWRESW